MMSKELIERLRDCGGRDVFQLCREAADALEALSAENERLNGVIKHGHATIAALKDELVARVKQFEETERHEIAALKAELAEANLIIEQLTKDGVAGFDSLIKAYMALKATPAADALTKPADTSGNRTPTRGRGSDERSPYRRRHFYRWMHNIKLFRDDREVSSR
jgi:hypothetical protein